MGRGTSAIMTCKASRITSFYWKIYCSFDFSRMQLKQSLRSINTIDDTIDEAKLDIFFLHFS